MTKEEGDRTDLTTAGITPLQDFVHDVGSQAGTLKGAAAILEKISPEKRERLLKLMVENSQKLAKRISDFQTRNR